MKTLAAFLILSVFMSLAVADYPAPNGLWEFNYSSNLNLKTIGTNLSFTGTQTAVQGFLFGDGAAQKTGTSYYTCTHSIAPNRGTYVNDWTLLLDIKSPAANFGGYVSLFQTTPANNNDGDCFISPTGTLGVEATGYSTNAISADKWYRIVISVSNGNFYRIYVNGTLWLEGTPQPVDGRFSLASTLLIFADEDGETGTSMYISNMMMWGQALTGTQVASLGSVDQFNPKGLWQFNNSGNLLQATIGSNLTMSGSHSAVPGFTAGDGAALKTGNAYYTCTHGIPPNRGTYVNDWTLMMDIKSPAANFYGTGYVSLYQTDQTNSNDGDCFISPYGAIGIYETDYTENFLMPDTWYRIVISVSNGNFYRIYVNGVLWLEGNPQDVDGRWSLDPSILIFADENGETGNMHVSDLAIWGRALSSTEIAALGAMADFNANLLGNPSAEFDLSLWTRADGNDVQSSDRSELHKAKRGDFFFAAGRGGHAELNQVIDLSSIATRVDAGQVTGFTNGYIGGDGTDKGRMLIEYRSAVGTVLTSNDSGLTVGGSGSTWTQKTLPSSSGQVLPVGTRFVKYRLITQRINGTVSHSYFDDLSWEYKLVISGNGNPAVPTISGATSGTTGTSYSLTFVCTDPQSDKVSYQIDWGDGSIDPWSAFQNSGTNYSASHKWMLPATYSVKVRSRDVNGGVSAWSSGRNMTISGTVGGVVLCTPYLQNFASNTMTINWESDRLVSASVDYGLTTSYGSNAVGICEKTFLYGKYVCKVPITSLSANTTYHYRTRCGTTVGSDHTFVTAPSSTTSFSFVVWGDSQESVAADTGMFTNMAASGAAFGVTAGDLVEDGTYSALQSTYEQYAANIFGCQKPFFVAWGNHDQLDGGFVHEFGRNPSRHSFSFNYGNAHFTCIDYRDCWNGYYMLPSSDGHINSLPVNWIVEDLSSTEAQSAAWRFVVLHVPPYSERWIDGSSNLRTYLVPLLETYNVDICFSGHVHEYERGYLNGVYYVITGCGSYLDSGEPVVYNWPHMTVGGAQNIPPYTGGCVNGYTQVTINGTSLTLQQKAFNSDGTYAGVIDTVVIP